MKKLIALLVLVTLLLLTTVSVFAVPPYHEIGTYENLYEYMDCAEHGDWDFIIMNDLAGKWIDHYYYNQDGNVIRLVGHLEGKSVFYNPNNPEKVVHGKYNSNWNVDFDPESGEVIDQQGAGILWTFRVEGKAYHVVGMARADKDWNWYKTAGQGLLNDGQWIAFGPGPADVVLCEYLATP
jgi:hypothetical protein